MYPEDIQDDIQISPSSQSFIQWFLWSTTHPSSERPLLRTATLQLCTVFASAALRGIIPYIHEWQQHKPERTWNVGTRWYKMDSLKDALLFESFSDESNTSLDSSGETHPDLNSWEPIQWHHNFNDETPRHCKFIWRRHRYINHSQRKLRPISALVSPLRSITNQSPFTQSPVGLHILDTMHLSTTFTKCSQFHKAKSKDFKRLIHHRTRKVVLRNDMAKNLNVLRSRFPLIYKAILIVQGHCA